MLGAGGGRQAGAPRSAGFPVGGGGGNNSSGMRSERSSAVLNSVGLWGGEDTAWVRRDNSIGCLSEMRLRRLQMVLSGWEVDFLFRSVSTGYAL